MWVYWFIGEGSSCTSGLASTTGIMDHTLGMEEEARIKPALEDLLDKEVVIMVVKQEAVTLVEVLFLMLVIVGLDMEL